MAVDEEKIAKAVRMIIEAVGEDPDRDGLKDTPERFARMYGELTSGYADNAEEHLNKTFAVETGDLVIERDISFSSTCEHHLMPFFGKAHIAYIPDGKVVGLSKLARVVDAYARRFQLQERMNSEIADAIYNVLCPKGAVVVIEAEHSCMTSRGVKKIGSKTLSYAVRGDIDGETLNRVFFAIGKRDHD